jgi:RNA polymerase sigma-32 factor
MSSFPNAREDHLTRLFAKARTFPLLGAEQERDLVKRARKKSDHAALTLLLGSHLRLVIKIAQGNRGYGLPVADLIAEGNVGLMEAVQRFDPDRGFRFATYAQWWIRAAINEYILKNWSLVRMGTTAGQKKLFFNLRRLKGSLGAYEDGDLSPEDIAKVAAALGVSEDEVLAMNRRLAGKERSLNASVGEEGDLTYQDLLVDDRPNAEAALAETEEFRKRWSLVKDALTKLSPRERLIVSERKIAETPKTLEELGAVYGVSRERIRQIEKAALKKLKMAVRAASAAQGLLSASDSGRTESMVIA